MFSPMMRLRQGTIGALSFVRTGGSEMEETRITAEQLQRFAHHLRLEERSQKQINRNKEQPM